MCTYDDDVDDGKDIEWRARRRAAALLVCGALYSTRTAFGIGNGRQGGVAGRPAVCASEPDGRTESLGVTQMLVR